MRKRLSIALKPARKPISNRPFSRLKERTLIRQAQSGNATALETLVVAHQGFILGEAQRLQGRGVELDDLRQEANEGFIEAIRRFNPDSPNVLISYAVWWIKQRLQVALAEDRMIRIPLNHSSNIAQSQRRQRALEQERSRTVSLPETLATMDLPGQQDQDIHKALATVCSLDTRLTQNGIDKRCLVDVMIDAEQEDSSEEVEYTERYDAIKAVLVHLDAREQYIIASYYGLQNRPPDTLEAIGQRLGLTRERVRQVRNRALEKLRQRDGELAEYLEAE